MTIIPVLTAFSKTIQANSGVSATANSAGLIEVTTSAAHGFQSGDIIQLSGVTGTVEANGQWIVTVVDSTHFTLNNSTYNNAFVSGGTVAHVGYSTPCTAFNQFYFPGVPTNITGKVQLQNVPSATPLRWVFEDADLNDPGFVTAAPGPSGSMPGGVSAKADWVWSFEYHDFPALRLNVVNNFRFRLLFGHPVPGVTVVLSVWFEV